VVILLIAIICSFVYPLPANCFPIVSATISLTAPPTAPLEQSSPLAEAEAQPIAAWIMGFLAYRIALLF
jgi:hypothetical protein